MHAQPLNTQRLLQFSFYNALFMITIRQLPVPLMLLLTCSGTRTCNAITIAYGTPSATGPICTPYLRRNKAI